MGVHPSYPDWRNYCIRDRKTNVHLASVGYMDRFFEKDTLKHAVLMASAPELLAALRRVVPWLGKMIADNGHMQAVLPNDAVRSLQMAEAAIEQATAGKAVQS